MTRMTENRFLTRLLASDCGWLLEVVKDCCWLEQNGDDALVWT